MQSTKFDNNIRSVFNKLTLGESETLTKSIQDKIDDDLASGDIDSIREDAKMLAKRKPIGGVEAVQGVQGREVIVEELDAIQSDLDDFEKSGGDTNIFTGTFEQVANKLGTTTGPQLKALGTKIILAMQRLRLSTTGKAFALPESKEYKQ